MKRKNFQFKEYHYKSMEKLIKFFVKEDKALHHTKIEWLSGMMKKQFYDSKEQIWLNKMRDKYNNK